MSTQSASFEKTNIEHSGYLEPEVDIVYEDRTQIKRKYDNLFLLT